MTTILRHTARTPHKTLDQRHEIARDETPRRFGPRPRQGQRRTGLRPRRDRDVEHFVRDETETLLDLEKGRFVRETETTSLAIMPVTTLTHVKRSIFDYMIMYTEADMNF